MALGPARSHDVLASGSSRSRCRARAGAAQLSAAVTRTRRTRPPPRRRNEVTTNARVLSRLFHAGAAAEVFEQLRTPDEATAERRHVDATHERPRLAGYQSLARRRAVLYRAQQDRDAR